MFERYTEEARRVLFYARYEASQLGSYSIEGEHLLLGLMRRPQGLIRAIFDRAHLPLERISEGIATQSAGRPKVPTSVEIPFGDDVKRSLMLAADEAELARDGDIGCEHLLLGLLRQPTSGAASILLGYGLQLEGVREAIAIIRRESAKGDVEGT
jgi:ATP-dependent Clp protease ATP-binding subunit ClpC